MKLGKRMISLVLALVMVFGLTTGASAAAPQNVKVKLSPNITVIYDNAIQSMTDVNGDPVYPIMNGGTTYLPIRAVGNMLGLDVDWDGATQTVILNKSTKIKTTSTASGGKTADPTEITVQISPNITVTYNGKVQSMTDVNGTPVYPLLYGGTTYLPVRAVSNMLGVDVDWDGATQTVLLGKCTKPGTATLKTSDGGILVAVSGMTYEAVEAELKAAGISDEDVKYLMNSYKNVPAGRPFILGIGYNDGKYYSVIAAPNGVDDLLKDQKYIKDEIDRFKTSEDAETLGEKHIGYDYAEIDWSTADDGYIRVKLNKQLGKFTTCTMVSYDADYNKTSHSFNLPVDKWYNVPLYDGSDEYFITIHITYYNEDIYDLPDEEWALIDRPDLMVRFTAEVKDENAWLTLSSGKIDYENAPNTQAKALELTENCKSDAEKVAAVFNWVAKNIKYDYKLSNEIEAHNAKIDAEEINPQYDLFMDGARANLNPDDILDSKSGVCQDFATLTVAMLRSLDIPCKYVSGDIYDNGKWYPHGWVAVSPDIKGLNAKTLNGWTDADRWVNIDPTNAIQNPNFTSKASNYKAEGVY